MFIRPFATFPHPNVWAGFVSIFFVLFFEKIKKNLMSKNTLDFTLSWVLLFIIPLSIFLSFSKSAWFIFFSFLLIQTFLDKPYPKLRWLITSFVLFCLGGVFVSRIQSLWYEDSQSISERLVLANIAIKIFTTQPWFGIGVGNFLKTLPSFTEGVYILQPVHSTYLLLLSETGIWGVSGFLGLIVIAVLKSFSNNRDVFFSLIVILFLGIVDHYLLTLSQGQLILGLILGLSLNKKT